MSNWQFELHLDNKDPEEFRNIVKTYLKEFSKDEHKVNYNFTKKPGSLGIPYIVVLDENSEVASYMAFDVHPINGVLNITTHCLSVRPAYRGNKLSEIMISFLESEVRKKFPNVKRAYEICNEISTKSYKKCGFVETGSYRLNKKGERILIRLSKTY